MLAVYSCGSNENGVLGTGGKVGRIMVPTLVPTLVTLQASLLASLTCLRSGSGDVHQHRGSKGQERRSVRGWDCVHLGQIQVRAEHAAQGGGGAAVVASLC